MSTDNNYNNILNVVVRPAVDQLNDELSAGSNFRIEIEEGNNLKNILSRAIAQQRNETVYSDKVQEPLGIYLNDTKNPSGHRPMAVTGFIGNSLYIVDPGIDGSIIDIEAVQADQEMIKNSLKKCLNI